MFHASADNPQRFENEVRHNEAYMYGEMDLTRLTRRHDLDLATQATSSIRS